MKNDIKKLGFIITYFNSCENSEYYLSKMIDIISSENYYVVLASHSPITEKIHKQVDFYFYQDLNIIDNRKYSHGVAENHLIKYSLNHLKDVGIEWTYKTSYDITINDITHFDSWIHNYKYQFVSCQWGEFKVNTNSFFGNIDFMLQNITFYDSIDNMFIKSNMLERCWEIDLENQMSHVYTYPSKQDFFGPNQIDVLYYDYDDFKVTHDFTESKFYITNQSNKLKYVDIKIFDYYSNLCMYETDSFELKPNIEYWFIPPVYRKLKTETKNGFYVTIKDDTRIIRKNLEIKDFTNRHKLHKKFRNINTVKYNEFYEFIHLKPFVELGLDIEKIKTVVDIGSNYGFFAVPFITQGIKTYLIDPDPHNINMLSSMYGLNSNIKIIDAAIYKKDGQIDFYVQNNQKLSVLSSVYNSNVFGENTDREKIQVNSINPNTLINSVISEDEIDLFKIDVEGAEYEIVESMSIESMQLINSFIIECHENTNMQILGITKKLLQAGFVYTIIDIDSYVVNPAAIKNSRCLIYAYKK